MLTLNYLRAVVLHFTEGQDKTTFLPQFFDFKDWSTKMLQWLNNPEMHRAELLDQMCALASNLEQVQAKLTEDGGAFRVDQGPTKIADVAVFCSTTLHAAAARKRDTDRVTAYMQLVPKIVVESEEYKGLLKTRYAAEYVLDRRTMVQPQFLVKMMAHHGVGHFHLLQAEHALQALCKGTMISPAPHNFIVQ